MTVQDLPHLNALLNSLAAVCMLAGWIAVRRGKMRLHGGLMIAATVISTAFLASYLTYHYTAGHRVFKGEGALRSIYLTVLVSHIVLAVVVVPLVLRTVYLAARRRWGKHRWWGRLTLPIWLYVSVTGVVVYLFLYVISG